VRPLWASLGVAEGAPGMNRRHFLRTLGLGVAVATLQPSIVLSPRWYTRESSIDLVKRLIAQGLAAMDDAIERALFTPRSATIGGWTSCISTASPLQRVATTVTMIQPMKGRSHGGDV
jgi:hypothetical protein